MQARRAPTRPVRPAPASDQVAGSQAARSGRQRQRKRAGGPPPDEGGAGPRGSAAAPRRRKSGGVWRGAATGRALAWSRHARVVAFHS